MELLTEGHIKYKNYTKLQSPEETLKSKAGSCHDQTYMELKLFSDMKLKSIGLFFIEYNPNDNQGGMTHSFVYYTDSNNIMYYENAWEDNKGIHPYKSVKDLKKDFENKHNKGDIGDYKKYPKLEWGSFVYSNHKPGESLQTLVDICLR